jgi:hypothetical protein
MQDEFVGSLREAWIPIYRHADEEGENMKESNLKGGNAVMTKILKQDADKRLADVPGEYAFWCNDGRIVKSIRELQETLEQMSDAVYAYHANAEKNDFSAWVKDVIIDQRLALDLAKSADRSEAAKRVAARVTYLASKQ